MNRLDIAVTGGCQCGAVRYASSQLMDNAHICHCRMCQKAVGNFFAALVGAPNDRLVWTRGEPAIFASSDLADRGFCAQCGTPLFYRGKGSPRTGLTIGSLDDPSLAPPRVQVGMEGRHAFLDDLLHLPDEGTTEEDMIEEAPLIAASNHQHPDHDTEQWPPR
ncbi:GFA family protein [Sphingobium nicotianae]|uniref:GFA family protein n=1 Tax=Sphingobium nicotianae TaxID=2782607 RepID=A0A9X1DAF4_9SPHN|nr:GFA family protein [Sphingobium nicotianae]